MPNPRQLEKCPLTEREEWVLKALAHGYQQREIARALGVAPGTIEQAIYSSKLKFGAHSTPQLLYMFGRLAYDIDDFDIHVMPVLQVTVRRLRKYQREKLRATA